MHSSPLLYVVQILWNTIEVSFIILSIYVITLYEWYGWRWRLFLFVFPSVFFFHFIFQTSTYFLLSDHRNGNEQGDGFMTKLAASAIRAATRTVKVHVAKTHLPSG